jgi:hypothetical protein
MPLSRPAHPILEGKSGHSSFWRNRAGYLFFLAAAARISRLLHISTVIARRPSAQKTPCFMSHPRLCADANVGMKVRVMSAAAPAATTNAFMDAPFRCSRRKIVYANEGFA